MNTTAHEFGRWLASADAYPERAHRWWQADEHAIPPLGRDWDVIQIDGAYPPDTIDGPIIADPVRRALYILVPPGTAQLWDVPGSDALSDGVWLAIPSPARTDPPGLHWHQLPVEAGGLTDPNALRSVLTAETESNDG
jgi:hypothetical protein